MIDSIFVESAVSAHPRTAAILKRYPRARVIECDQHQAIFNRRNQNFRVQKSRPCLILAAKSPPYLHPVPGSQHLGAKHNYYFSHLLNCPFDCRYCFLQGMFASANYVLFVNYEDFANEIGTICGTCDSPAHLFSGYDGDSLALEPLTGFASFFVDAIAPFKNTILELRTKSTQIRTLLARSPQANCVVAMSLAPSVIVEWLEHGTPSLAERLDAIFRLQTHGWPVGLRFDPLIPIENAIDLYAEFFRDVFARINVETLHSVTLGPFRLPRDFGKRMFKMFPDEALFAGPLVDVGGTYVFGADRADDLQEAVYRMLAEHVPPDKIFKQL